MISVTRIRRAVDAGLLAVFATYVRTSDDVTVVAAVTLDHAVRCAASTGADDDVILDRVRRVLADERGRTAARGAA